MNKYLKEIHKAKTDMAKSIVIDLDGVITDFEHCSIGCDYTGYPEKYLQLQRDKCPINPDAISTLKKIKSKGMRIIIYTSRILAEKKVTENWLKKNGVIYDELVFGKPRALLYCDDLAHEFKSWDNLLKEIDKRCTNPSSQT